jgi:hypothetical protein
MQRQRITDPAFHERFWSRMRVSGGCWLWTGSTDSGGYGHVSCAGKIWKVHRVAWTITHGPIAAGLFVCHNCPGGDCPACCRPDHLWLGTQADNVRDPFARLTDEDVRAIRQRRTEGWTYRRIAADFGITYQTVAQIATHQRWKHVT